MNLICFADVLGRALGQSDSEEVELGSDEVMEDVDDGVKEKPKINIFSVAFNVGTVVVTGISIVLIWVLPQQEGQDAHSKVQNEKRPTKVAKHEAVDNDVTLESDEKIDQTSNSTQPIT